MALEKKNVTGATNHKYRCSSKCLTIVGCFLVLMNNGVFWFWGNMSVYCTSYLVSVLNITSDVQSPWVFSIFVISWTLGVLVSRSVSERIGRRFTILLGAVVFNTGLFCSYFSVQSSMVALTITVGGATGLGTGFMDGSGIQLGIDWAGDRVGLITCVLQGSFSFGALLINQVITLYANPKNLPPNYYLSPTKYFTQKEVLDNVPSMFLVVGCYTSCLHFIGFLMLREKPAAKKIDRVTYSTAEDTASSHAVEVNSNTSENTALLQPNGKEQSGGRHDLVVKESFSEDDVTTEKEDYSNSTSGNNRDYTLPEVIRTKSFYAVWMCFFCSAMANVLASNYYKTFGQIWIKDDYFMANIATLMSLGSAVMSTIMGFLIDYFGAKNCSIFANGCMALVLFWYYFTPQLNKWLYMVTVVIFVCQAGSLFSTYTAFAALLYGKKYFTTNFGLLLTAQLLFNIISPYFVGFLLTELGWFATYTFTGALISLSLIPLVFFIPNF